MALIDEALYSDVVIPNHVHQWEFAFEGEYEETLRGVICAAEWLVTPLPRGKKPRKRRCGVSLDANETLLVFSAAYPDTASIPDALRQRCKSCGRDL